MENINLKAEKREVVGKRTHSLRRKGVLPAVVYGHHRKAESVQIPYAEFEKVFKVASESTLVNLLIGDKESKILIHGVDVDPVTGRYRHADLYEVDLKEKVTTTVPLVFKGEAPAVKELAGVLVKSMDEIEIECLPMDIPKNIVVNIGNLKTFEDLIKIKDLEVPAGIEVKQNSDEVIATVEAPRSEEELEQLSAEVVEDVQAVEGVKKEPKPEEAAEGAEGAKKGDKKAEKESAKKE